LSLLIKFLAVSAFKRSRNGRSYPIFMVSGKVVVAKVRMMSPVSSRLLSFFLSEYFIYFGDVLRL